MTRPTHCWHPTGHGVSWGMMGGGKDDHQCCVCGQVEAFERKVTESAVPGHGPFFTTTTTSYDFGNEPCPKLAPRDPYPRCRSPLGAAGIGNPLYCTAFCDHGPPKAGAVTESHETASER